MNKESTFKPTKSYPPGTNRNRPPTLKSPICFKAPKALHTLINNEATRRRVSVSEVILNALENEFGRKANYVLDFYEEVLPQIQKAQDRLGITETRTVLL